MQLKNYGQWGPTVGRGAGGRVRLMQRYQDQQIVAVKEFRSMRPGENEAVYRRKAVSELCMGAALQHRNVIQTIDVFISSAPMGFSGRQYWGVMGYAPFDLFSVVMSGQMCRKELYCLFRQIVDGVDYLHTHNLAHRDLKLDNCVLTRNNVVKLIDFGTATSCDHVPAGALSATGVVGSDPYLAPEVLSQPRYDPRLVDVWSLGIIFLCMVLRRFPWKLADARVDPSFRLYVQSHPELVRAPSSTRPEPAFTSSKTLSAVVERSNDELAPPGRSSPLAVYSAPRGPLLPGPNERAESPLPRPSTRASTVGSTPSTPPSDLFDRLDGTQSAATSKAGSCLPSQIPTTSCLACAQPARSSTTDEDLSTVCDSFSPATPRESNQPEPKPEPEPEPEPTVPEARPSKASETTYKKGSADSIFRLIPRECRKALQHMLAVHPGQRWTLNQLLRGEYAREMCKPISLPTNLVQAQSLLKTPRPSPPVSVRHGTGDPWLGCIGTCADLLDDPDARADHPHVHPTEEATLKKGFFHR